MCLALLEANFGKWKYFSTCHFTRCQHTDPRIRVIQIDNTLCLTFLCLFGKLELWYSWMLYGKYCILQTLWLKVAYFDACTYFSHEYLHKCTYYVEVLMCDMLLFSSTCPLKQEETKSFLFVCKSWEILVWKSVVVAMLPSRWEVIYCTPDFGLHKTPFTCGLKFYTHIDYPIKHSATIMHTDCTKWSHQICSYNNSPPHVMVKMAAAS